VPDLNCEVQDLLLEVVDLKQEVPDLRSGGILPPPPIKPVRATLSVLQEALVLQDVAGGLVELDVVDDAVGEVLSAHVGVGSASDEKA